MTATEVLVRALSAALDNAGDMRVPSDWRDAFAWGAVLGDVFVTDGDSFPESGYLEVYDDSTDPPELVEYTRGELQAPLSALWRGYLENVASKDLEAYLRDADTQGGD